MCYIFKYNHWAPSSLIFSFYFIYEIFWYSLSLLSIYSLPNSVIVLISDRIFFRILCARGANWDPPARTMKLCLFSSLIFSHNQYLFHPSQSGVGHVARIRPTDRPLKVDNGSLLIIPGMPFTRRNPDKPPRLSLMAWDLRDPTLQIGSGGENEWRINYWFLLWFCFWRVTYRQIHSSCNNILLINMVRISAYIVSLILQLRKCQPSREFKGMFWKLTVRILLLYFKGYKSNKGKCCFYK